MSERKFVRDVTQDVWDEFIETVIPQNEDPEDKFSRHEYEDWENREQFGIFW